MVYPRESLQESSFPLHASVLKAFIRELLLLDGSLLMDLSLSSKPVLVRCSGDDYIVSPPFRADQENDRHQLVDQVGKKRKRDIEITADGQDAVSSAITEPSSPETIDSAGALVQAIYNGVHLVRSTSTTCQTFRPPRKVSDSSDRSLDDEKTSIATTIHTPFDEIAGANDISRFWPFQKSDVELSAAAPEVQASIFTELMLRTAALETTHRLARNFDLSTLHLFFGYKTSKLQEERLVQVINDYLFDCSHAMFVFTASRKDDRSLDMKLFFEKRATAKVGGVDEGSLLCNALSIHLSKDDDDWSKLAASQEGKRMLQHHGRRLEQLKLGRKRRGDRLRRGNLASDSFDDPRSRASSFSSEGDEPSNVQQSIHGSVIDVPSILHMKVAKGPNGSWGIILAKEGDMCVVLKSQLQELLVGDLVLQVNDGEGACVRSPSARASGCVMNDGDEDWFQSIVSMFRSSNELHLMVQRVDK